MDHDLLAVVEDGGDDGERNAPTSGGGDLVGEGEHHLRTGLHTQKTQKEISDELNGSFNDLVEAKKGLTPEFAKAASKDELHTKLLEVETIIKIYRREYRDFKLDTLPSDRRAGWEAQNNSMLAWESQIKKYFDDAEASKQDEKTNTSKGGSADTELTGTTYVFKVGSDGAKLVEEVEKERKEHTAEIKKLREEMKEVATATNVQIDQLKTANRIQMDQLRSNADHERQLAERKIAMLEQQLLNRQPDELSYDEVDVANAEEEAGEGTAQSQEQATVNLKLDSFQLPHFNGNLDDWQTFRDMFEYLVDKSKKMTKIMKFHQLRSVLTGPALDCIRGYQVTERNYDAAWFDLKKRFDRTNELSDEYIRRFLEVPALKIKATHLTIRAIIDATNQMLRALPGLRVPVSNWDPFLKLIIRTKLNEEIRSEWIRQQARDTTQDISDLLDFLENKAIEMQPIQLESLNQLMGCEPKRKGSPRIFQVNEQPPNEKKQLPKCGLCDGLHRTTRCFQLTKADVKSCYALVKRHNLCFKCLQTHKAENCARDNCSHCSKPHHPVLCFKKEAEKENIAPNLNQWERTGPSGSKN